MPSTIPYDPSLILANVISEKALDIVEKIATTQAPVDAAQEDLDAMLASKRSLDLTGTELINLKISINAIDTTLTELITEIGTAAGNYATEKTKAETTIRGLRKDIHSLHSQVESPVDYVKTEIKSMPLAADSMSMDVQYFSLDSAKQKSRTLAQDVASRIQVRSSDQLLPERCHQRYARRNVGRQVLP